MMRWAAILICLCLLGCSKQEIPVSTATPTVRAWLLATGKSMLPKYPEKSYIEVEFGVPFDHLKSGDAVIFWDYKRSETALTHHRLVQKQGDGWIAQGDNNLVADQSWVTRDNYLGRGTGRWAIALVAN